MTFGFGQFLKLRKQKLTDGTKYLGATPPYPLFLPSVGGGSTTIIPTGVNADGYSYTTFTGSGPLTFSSPTTVDILVIAGGGAGGARVSNTVPGNAILEYGGGGGGGGGVGFVSAYTFSAGTYSVVIGSGSVSPLSLNSRGSDTYIENVGTGVTIIRAIGGGNGRGTDPTFSSPGGSGGGGSSIIGLNENATTALQPTTSQPGLVGGVLFSYGSSGAPGNTAAPSLRSGSGGGGALTGGSQGGSNPGGAGGAGGSGRKFYPSPDIPERSFSGSIIGVPALSPLSGFYAGGGGGGGVIFGGNGGSANGGGGGGGGAPSSGPTSPGAGGLSDGGNPGFAGGSLNSLSGNGGNGLTNSGGGGGGAGGLYNPAAGITTGGQGGSGLVVIRQRIL